MPGTQLARSETILVIEDESIVEHVLKNILGSGGYRVMSATDGQAGLTLFDQHAMELALMIVDLDLPALNGLEFIQHIPTLTPRIPVIFITGLGEYASLVVEAERQNFPGICFSGFEGRKHWALGGGWTKVALWFRV